MAKQKFSKQEQEDFKNSLLIPKLTPSQIASGLQITTGAEIGVIMDGDRIINPHVPLFMQKTPWYTDEDGFKGKEKVKGEEGWYERGAIVGTATKYRKGACENCGSMTHKKRDCLDRPRKKGAKHTGLDIKPDESISKVHLGFEAKRDRWNGYQPETQLEAVKEFQLVEEKRQAIRELNSGTGSVQDDFQADNVDQRVDTKSRLTVRNLRMREDTAKYLRNLDPESAYYDPKTRSMRENPYGKEGNQLYAGDNFERYSGEVKRAVETSAFSWEEGKIPSVQSSNPTLAEKMVRERKGEVKRTVNKGLLAKYGGEEYLETMPSELRQVDEEYVTYTATGDKIGEKKRVKLVSKYKEDLFPGNHSSVWGSWYEDGVWGFKCCHEVLRSAYCGGRESIAAKNAQKRKRGVMEESDVAVSENTPAPVVEKSLMELHRENAIKNQMASQQRSVQEIETEEYQKTRIRKNDPMESYFKKK